MVTEGKNVRGCCGSSCMVRGKVREVLKDSEIVDEIFRYFGADQALDFFQSIATDYGVS